MKPKARVLKHKLDSGKRSLNRHVDSRAIHGVVVTNYVTADSDSDDSVHEEGARYRPRRHPRKGVVAGPQDDTVFINPRVGDLLPD